MHGNVELIFVVTEKIKFGFHLRGTYALRGHFFHGQLEGQVILKFQDQRVAFVSVKNGILHGPAVIAGTVHILPVRFKK